MKGSLSLVASNLVPKKGKQATTSVWGAGGTLLLRLSALSLVPPLLPSSSFRSYYALLLVIICIPFRILLTRCFANSMTLKYTMSPEACFVKYPFSIQMKPTVRVLFYGYLRRKIGLNSVQQFHMKMIIILP